MLTLPQTGRFFRTVRYLKPGQVLARARRALRDRLRLRAAPDGRAKRLLPLRRDAPGLDGLVELRAERARVDLDRAEAALRNQFVLANRTHALGPKIDWRADDLWAEEPLAAFELHYQGYLQDLALAWQQTRDRRYADRCAELVLSWLKANRPGRHASARLAWSPYVVSERLRNWLTVGSLLGDKMRAEFRARMELSAARQLAFLADNLEYGLLGNHLLQNLCGAAVTTCFFDGPAADPLRERVLNELVAEMDRQLLADGLHQERSFFYHVKAIEDVLEVIAAAEGYASGEAPGSLESALGRMAGVLAGTLEVVGDLPLMNDTREITPARIRAAIRCAGARTDGRRPSLDDRMEGSGYLVGRVGRWSAVFDVGAAGPDHQMGHAHADHLGFELWRDGHKLLCDSGNATYRRGRRRAYYRGTAAHNTVQIDGQDSLELWKSHRVGRRPRVNSGELVARGDDVLSWEGMHDGFAHLEGRPVHRRRFWMGRDGICVRDRVEGRGRHNIRTALHFHPDVAVGPGASRPERGALPRGPGFAPWALQFARDAKAWDWTWALTSVGRGHAVALWPASADLQPVRETSFYAPDFAVELERPVIGLTGTVDLPLELTWVVW